jgi:hypothetical protein
VVDPADVIFAGICLERKSRRLHCYKEQGIVLKKHILIYGGDAITAIAISNSMCRDFVSCLPQALVLSLVVVHAAII